MNEPTTNPTPAVAVAQPSDAVVSAIIFWLEANQPDVFKRGLWDAIGDTSLSVAAPPTGAGEPSTRLKELAATPDEFVTIPRSPTVGMLRAINCKAAQFDAMLEEAKLANIWSWVAREPTEPSAEFAGVDETLMTLYRRHGIAPSLVAAGPVEQPSEAPAVVIARGANAADTLQTLIEQYIEHGDLPAYMLDAAMEVVKNSQALRRLEKERLMGGIL